MRKKHSILMEEEQPVGGQWNFDKENRKPISKKIEIPTPEIFFNNVNDVYEDILKCGCNYFGEIEPEKFSWPINRNQSLELLNYFMHKMLANFGTYQDAMDTNHWNLFHSRLSFALNSKMLSPKEVVDAAIEEYLKNTDKISISQIEGFVRQIIGWREYMRGIYWWKMPEFSFLNFLNHKNKLPEWFWSGNTKMNCLSHSIKQSLKHAYAHHIQRLMVTGNFLLLAMVNPDEIDEWYLGIYIDAIEWVEITNTRDNKDPNQQRQVLEVEDVELANEFKRLNNSLEMLTKAMVGQKSSTEKIRNTNKNTDKNDNSTKKEETGFFNSLKEFYAKSSLLTISPIHSKITRLSNIAWSVNVRIMMQSLHLHSAT
jgi:hypothetical protein